MRQIVKEIVRPSKEILERYRALSSPTIHEASGRLGAMDSSIGPIWRGMKCCGPAFTVKCHVGDNLTLLKAIDIAEKGDILVVDFGAFSEVSPWGEIASLACLERGLGGLVINSSVRDTARLKELAFPVFALGSCMKGTTKESFGLINHPISCGGVVVSPGDVVVGDDDGVVVVEQKRAEEVLEKSIERDAKEAKIMERLSQGESLFTMLGFDKKLKTMGIEE